MGRGQRRQTPEAFKQKIMKNRMNRASSGNLWDSEHARGVASLAPALIKARIMRNWTQKELADKLAVAEQQVQRYEATQYKGVSVERLQAVADALKLRVRELITFEPL